ncbi:MAG TPA: tetratricopeptide repeat protein [Pirellulales bacterium]|nr:tetratricopeptide repeat protein [Pirellulales bacterium]
MCAFLVGAVVLVFGQTLSFGFLNWDDNLFVSNEPRVSGGFSWRGIVWAFTSGPAGEWYPLAPLSHMLDCQLFGLNAGGHHLTNVLLHAATSVALFLVLCRMTDELWPSALVAAVFAVHPQHVESVAWVAERRDVLSGLFFMLTLASYAWYVERPSRWRYAAVATCFVLGLMAKPMLVTLPPLLLLLDYWPLGRLRWHCVVEKIPLFVLAAADGLITMHTHATGESIPLPWSVRLGNAAVSCVSYIAGFFRPVDLSAFYPMAPAGPPAWKVAGAIAFLTIASVAAVICRRRCPYLFVGWFWFLGVLSPVLGLVGISDHAMADRYMYLPSIGLCIALAWGATRLAASWPPRRWVLAIGSALVLAALTACAWRQTRCWQSDHALWQHAVACDPGNVRARCALATAIEENDDAGAAAHYWRVLETDPSQHAVTPTILAKAHNGLGNLATRKRDFADAAAHYARAIEQLPGWAAAHTNLGRTLARQGKVDEALAEFQNSVELDPAGAAPVYRSMGIVLAQHGRIDGAIVKMRQAVTADPKLGIAHVGLAALLAQRGDADEAIIQFRRAIEIDPFVAARFYPDVAFPYQQLAQLLRKQGAASEAVGYEALGEKIRRRYAPAPTTSRPRSGTSNDD